MKSVTNLGLKAMQALIQKHVQAFIFQQNALLCQILHVTMEAVKNNNSFCY